MADVFEERPELEEHRQRLFALIEATPELDWQLLTKRPEFARDWLRSYYFDAGYPNPWHNREWIDWGVLRNVWVGVSVENQRWTWRVDVLRQIPSAVRFISAEPLLESLLRSDTFQVERSNRAEGSSRPLDLEGIDWLIVGGESGGKKSRPLHPSWARELREACLERGIAFHMKQWGSWTPDPYGADAVWIHPKDGAKATSFSADALGLDLTGAMLMRYAGASPKAGGKLLDGREWCEFPESPALVLA